MSDQSEQKEKVESLEDSNSKLSSKPSKIVQSKYWSFTWNNYTEKGAKDLEILLKSKCAKFRFQSEVGASGTPHLQGHVEMTKKGRWSEFKAPKDIHWDRVRNIKASEAYCIKNDTWDGKIRVEYGFPKPKKEYIVIPDEKLYPWQKSVIQSISQPPDDRIVNWIYDPIGGNGKSIFGKYIDHKFKNSLVINNGSMKDIAYILKTKQDDPEFDINDMIVIMIDIPRSLDDERINYTLIEKFKDGFVTSPKFESCILKFNPCHMWILSNAIPEMHKLSQDRWRVWTISDKKLIKWSNPLDD